MSATKRKKSLDLEEFIANRDYAGAISILEFHSNNELTDLWLGYCAFHSDQNEKALKVYQRMLSNKNNSQEANAYIGCIYFFLGMFAAAKEFAEKGSNSALKNRLLMHIYSKTNDENRVDDHICRLEDTIEDQLCLASIHYLRSNYQEAIVIYKRMLAQNEKNIALNVYLSMCHFKLGCYDIAQKTLQLYLKYDPESPAAMNLQACNQYKLYDGKAAAKELIFLKKHPPTATFMRDLIAHNMVVFQDGNRALQTLPALITKIPEARINLIIFHLRKDDVSAAAKLTDELNPKIPQEFLLKAITKYILGYHTNSKEYTSEAEHYFKTVGECAAECDTILGRQAMASAYFLMQQFEDVLVYLNSIKSYLCNDDTFNFNIGQALLKCGNSIDAEACFQLIMDNELKKRSVFVLCMVRAYIHNKKVKQAWEIYSKVKQHDLSFAILRIIANDCYKMREYFSSAKAFDELERLEPNPEYWEGKRGAIAGVFKHFVEGTASLEQLKEAMNMVESSRHSQVQQIANVIKKFCKTNKIPI